MPHLVTIDVVVARCRHFSVMHCGPFQGTAKTECFVPCWPSDCHLDRMAFVRWKLAATATRVACIRRGPHKNTPETRRVPNFAFADDSRNIRVQGRSTREYMTPEICLPL